MTHERTSSVLTKGEARAKALREIDAALDLGRGLTLKAYEKAIADGGAALSAYNQAVEHTNALRQIFRDAENRVRALNKQMLKGVASQFGEDSVAYGTAGGMRESERPPRRRNKKGAAANPGDAKVNG